MKQCYNSLLFFFLFEWCHAQSGLFRVNTDQNSVAVMHSFKPPFQNKLFFWEAGAGTTITNEYVQLTPAKQGSTGFIWNKKKANMQDWEVVFEFKLKGRPDMGGDGFAFWYTDKVGLIGPVYGSSDFWTGLGVFFDTFNNDGKDESPLISLCLNDGTQTYLLDRDGAGNALATCGFKIRNTEGKVNVRLRYTNAVLNLEIAMENDALGLPIFLSCAEVKNVLLSPEGFFGFSAHTGDLADSHDIYSMTVKDLSPLNADLNEVKKRWDEEQETLHRQHNDQSESEFKHSMLTQLRQTQEEVNMIEMTTLSDAKEITKALEMVSMLEVLIDNVFSQFREKMKSKGVDLPNLDPDLDITNAFNKVKDIAYSLKSSRETGGKGDITSNQVVDLTNQINDVQRDLATFRLGVTTVKGQVNQLAEKLISQKELEMEYASNPGGKNSGWWTYIIISIITIPLGGVLMHFCKPKRSKYRSWD